MVPVSFHAILLENPFAITLKSLLCRIRQKHHLFLFFIRLICFVREVQCLILYFVCYPTPVHSPYKPGTCNSYTDTFFPGGFCAACRQAKVISGTLDNVSRKTPQFFQDLSISSIFLFFTLLFLQGSRFP